LSWAISVTAPTGLVRGDSRPCPWPAQPRNPRTPLLVVAGAGVATALISLFLKGTEAPRSEQGDAAKS
jgi:hypothetical protein